MTHTNGLLAHPTTANGNDSHRAAPSSERQARIQLISDGVVASYIHDISTRHRGGNRVPARSRKLAA